MIELLIKSNPGSRPVGLSIDNHCWRFRATIEFELKTAKDSPVATLLQQLALVKIAFVRSAA